MKLRSSVAALAGLALCVAVPTVSTAAPAADPHTTFAKAPSSGRLSATVTPRALQSTKKVDVIVQLTGDPVAVAEAKAGAEFSESKRGEVKSKLRTAQDVLGKEITAKGGKVTYRMQSAYNGVRVRIQASKVADLTDLPGVESVHALTPKTLANTESVPFIGTGTAWESYAKTGKGVKIAIIDTGIDYTHADFGGPGTTEAFEEAKKTSDKAADESLFGPSAPRVKGGYDFVGDAYDAGGDTEAATTPKPDPNPLDCEGHGSHVAGTAAGNGVTSEGTAYTGPYNKSTQKNTSFKVGPGVAPQADLYALRVFGCSGSTDVTAEAIDWAVDNRMDVINMSLGGPFGRSSDPDAVAASNAVAAGVVVVASAGNEGSAPYIVGSPSVGQGVISVAAVDSMGQFPGASLQTGGTSLTAINANGAEVKGGNYPVVVVQDDPDTAEVESLGCSVDAFQAAGIEPGKNQIAIVHRGTCARVAKAIYGQQAGAAAVLMVNSDAGYPPFEGRITSNPDNGDAFIVTIPFLGVPSTDGDKLVTGQTLTMVATTIENPGFRNYADFSSSGPVNGDSGLSPSVAAPGVSISSVAVGTGTDSTVLSGTSMAAPHVAGVAALAVQAHPRWRASQIASAIVGTADPEKLAEHANSITMGGTGLVDPAQAVATQTFVTGDKYFDSSGVVWEDSLSFGFAESNTSFVKTKSFTISNTGATPVTYTIANDPDDESRPATVRFNASKVVVPARGSATVKVTLSAPASSIGSSIADADDQFNFYEVSGQVVLTARDDSMLRVPYLLVPRAASQLSASIGRDPRGQLDVAKPGPATSLRVQLANPGGALTATADFYTLGLSDRADVKRRWGGSGYDLRAAGVQSFDYSDETHASDKQLVFAVNNHNRWSNAATNEFDVLIDTNGDAKPDFLVFSYDSGYVRTGSSDGLTEVFYSDLSKKDDLNATGFLASAPTDSSTILLPVIAGDLGLTAAKGAFTYTVESYSNEDAEAGDSFTATATYNPWAKAIEDGDYQTVKPNRTLTVPVAVNPGNWATQKPLGVMVVSMDNRAGAAEAHLLTVR